MTIPLLVFKGFSWAKENGQTEEYGKQYKEYFGVEFCLVCGKPKPPKDFTPYSTECDTGYTITLGDGSKHPGYCDSKRLELEWPPK